MKFSNPYIGIIGKLILFLLISTSILLAQDFKKVDHPQYDELKKYYQQYINQYKSGKLAEARLSADKTLKLAIKIYGENSLETALAYNNLGTVCTYTGSYSEAEQYHRKALNIRKAKLGPAHIDLATSYNNLGLAVYHQGRIREAVKLYKISLDIYLKSLPEENRTIAVMNNNLGRAFESLGNYPAAIAHMKKALETGQKTTGRDSSFTATCHNNLAGIYRSAGNYEASVEHYEKAREIGKKSGDEGTIINARYGLAMTFYMKGRYDESLDHFASALAYYAGQYGPDHVYCANIYISMANVYRDKGEFKKAREYYNKAGTIYTSIYGKDHQYMASVYTGLGETFRAEGNISRAIEYHLLSVRIYSQYLGEGHVHTASCYVYLGGAYKSGGMYTEAINAYNKALDIYLKTLGTNHSYVATTYTNLGGVYEPMGEYDKAIKYYSKALAIYDKTIGRVHSYTATTINNLGLAYFKKDEFSMALKYYREAYKIYVKMLGRNHPHVAIALNNIGLAYHSLKDYGNAESYFNKALEVCKKSTDRDTYIQVNRNIAGLYEITGKPGKAAGIYRDTIGKVLKYRMELGRGKSGFLTRHASLFDKLIEIELSNKNFREAFRIDSMKKGLSISEGLSLKDALSRGNVSNNEKKTFISLQDRINDLQSKHTVLINQSKMNEAQSIIQKIWETERSRDKMNNELLRKYPAYAELILPKAPKVPELKKLLSKDEALICYSFTVNRLTAFIISGDTGFSTVTMDTAGRGISNKITTKVKVLHRLLRNPAATAGYRVIKRPDGETTLIDESEIGSKIEIRGKDVYRITESDPSSRRAGEKQQRKLKVGILSGRLEGTAAANARNKLLKELYELVLSPLSDRIRGMKKLIIVPDGPLYYLPFGLLKDTTGKSLMDGKSICLVHSAIVWQGIKKRNKTTASLPLLAMGNAVYNKEYKWTGYSKKRGIQRKSGIDTDIAGTATRKTGMGRLRAMNFSNLPGTGVETGAIIKISYAAKERIKHLYTGPFANEDVLFYLKNSEKLKEYRILHFAAHGLLVDDSPDLNSLVLTQPDVLRKEMQKAYGEYEKKYGPMKRDGFLRMGEIKTLGLDCDLVVLSACETSLGETMAGEGMVALPQAFLIGGARSVIASLWPVDDEATSILMEELYTNLFKKKLSPEEALRKAQLVLSEEYDDPYYWGAFVLYGN